MTAMLIDSHCHLDSDNFAPELDAVVARARAAGVGGCVAISTKLATFSYVRAIAERFENVWCSVGSHPEEAAAEPLDSAAELIARTHHPKVIGIGETGLEYFHEGAPRGIQVKNFLYHIEAARQTGLPLIVHTRNADETMAGILREQTAKGAVSGVLHCFSSGRALAECALELGFYISVSGIATFKKADALRAILKDVPLDRLLVETDAPYLAPVPHRGRCNEPSFVVATAAMLADIKGVAAEEVARATTENFFRLFTKAVPVT